MSVVNHNIEKRLAALERALRIARRTDAEAITLQEVCAWQAALVVRRNPGWSISYKPERPNDRCRVPDSLTASLTPAGRMVGNLAIWTGGTRGWVVNHTFGPQRVAEDRTGLACIAWRADVVYRACSVHLISPWAPEDVKVRTAQARDVKRITNPWVRDDEVVIVGGDFNAQPGRRTMRHLYASGGAGRFRESDGPRRGRRGCPCPRSTYDRGGVKIDYVFFSANRVDRRAYSRLRIVRTVSDHHLLVGVADVDVARR